MNVSMLIFILAASILAAAWLGLYIAKRRGHPFLETQADPQPWSLPQLVLASFLTLFAELAFIRWIAVEVRVFAYFKNLTLLLCFVGFGLGCALVSERVRWSAALKAFLGLVLIVRLPWSQGPLERLSQNLGAAADVNIWATGNQWRWVPFCGAALLAAALFLLIVVVFIPLGQTVSRQMNAAPRPLSAYSWNLLGSLLGILAFLGISRIMLPSHLLAECGSSRLCYFAGRTERTVAGHRADRSAGSAAPRPCATRWLYCLDSLSTNSIFAALRRQWRLCRRVSPGQSHRVPIHSESFLLVSSTASQPVIRSC